MRRPTTRPTARRDRPGLTLVELLVTIALMLLIMSIIVAVFTAATGAMSTAQRDQELAGIARRVESLLLQDLRGATARFTPPLDPADNLGYFEYGENSFADAQNEDTDDYLAFTVRAPAGQPFTGRIMLPRGVWPAGVPLAGQTRYAPTTITSETAEVIYFLRHGNLYRRVLLVAPNQQVAADIVPVGGGGLAYRFAASHNSDGFSLTGDNFPQVSWQGANDISVRPSSTPGFVSATNNLPPIPNSLGDLTNRHNRAFRPGFRDDLLHGSTPQVGGDGTVDDYNTDGVADFYPTLYPNIMGTGRVRRPTFTTPPNVDNSYDALGFPFVFPSAYSRGSTFLYGQINAGPEMVYQGSQSATTRSVRNHSPLQIGENLVGDSAEPALYWSPTAASGWTFWGFPTWAETRSIGWTAANKRLDAAEFGAPVLQQAFGLSWQRRRAGNPDLLPPQSHWYSDGAGDPNLIPPDPSWQDDLIATNVRSFDVKVLDPNAPAYADLIGRNVTTDFYDLGYATALKAAVPTVPPGVTPGAPAESYTFPAETTTLGHEGRIPPLTTDFRIDYQMEQVFGDSAVVAGRNDLGDDNDSTDRLRRVWDTWSTDYAFAPLKGLDPSGFPPYAGRPLYPSFPPPYPAPLRGIQIQIRLATPDETRLKVLTIRHDFTDKL